MKIFKAIGLMGVIVIILDVASIMVFKILGLIPEDQYGELMTKSLTILLIVIIAALVISGVVTLLSRKSE